MESFCGASFREAVFFCRVSSSMSCRLGRRGETTERMSKHCAGRSGGTSSERPRTTGFWPAAVSHGTRNGGGAFGPATTSPTFALERLFRDVQGARYHPVRGGDQRRYAGRLALGVDVNG